MNTRKQARLFAAFSAAVVLAGCGADSGEPPQRPRGVLVTTTTIASDAIEHREFTVGRLESKVDPDIAAEVSGRVVEVRAEVGDQVAKDQVLATIDAEDYRLDTESARAEIGRLQAMIEQQRRLVTRYEALKEDDFFPENTLDEAQSQLKVLQQQLTSARARLAQDVVEDRDRVHPHQCRLRRVDLAADQGDVFHALDCIAVKDHAERAARLRKSG